MSMNSTNVKSRQYVNLAFEALQQPATLEVSLRRLSRGQPRMALEFGAAVAELADSPPKWLELFI